MDLVMLVLVLAVVGFIIHLILTYVPMPPIFRTVIIIVVVIVLILFLLRKFGSGIPNIL